MRKVKIGILVFVFLLVSYGVFAAQITSNTYKQNVIVSEGGDNVSSSSYKTSIALGIINSIASSASYINKLGFFNTWLLADNQPCTSASQCEGGYCCSSLCASSACPTTAPSGGGGSAAAAPSGGGGGVAAPTEIEKIKDFSVSQNSIKEQLVLGGAKTITIKIKNIGNTPMNFDLSSGNLKDFIFLSETSFSLDAGQEKAVEVNIIGKKLSSYLGEIEIASEGIKKSISVVIEVESEQVLFDAKVDITALYKKVEAGSDLKAQVTLLNVGPPKKVDVMINYIMKDKKGVVFYESSETFAVEKQTSYVKSFKIPKELQPGDYIVIVEVRYANSFAVSSELFKVAVAEGELALLKTLKSKTVLTYTLVIFIGLMSLFVYLLIPKVKVSGRTKLEKCYKTIKDAEKSIGKKDVSEAKKIYAKARKIYYSLEREEKKEVYGKLMSLYNKLK